MHRHLQIKNKMRIYPKLLPHLQWLPTQLVGQLSWGPYSVIHHDTDCETKTRSHSDRATVQDVHWKLVWHHSTRMRWVIHASQSIPHQKSGEAYTQSRTWQASPLDWAFSSSSSQASWPPLLSNDPPAGMSQLEKGEQQSNQELNGMHKRLLFFVCKSL